MCSLRHLFYSFVCPPSSVFQAINCIVFSLLSSRRYSSVGRPQELFGDVADTYGDKAACTVPRDKYVVSSSSGRETAYVAPLCTRSLCRNIAGLKLCSFFMHKYTDVNKFNHCACLSFHVYLLYFKLVWYVYYLS